jgi:enamine deaminase RidA (YjgF/YER057c/UK114 family)
VGGDNAYNQAIAAFAGVERTLKAMGYGHKDVTRLTIFVVDFPKVSLLTTQTELFFFV